ncbi:hypothetical protein C4544_03495 [candidate division WS5 bacterium]|uniref:Cthe-2314-like HEPN domain-containing protein n=1 Tax=candidate division WS5 bacterium TaxID=2093353 RepID=A0A419DDN9_9BACT|nr:MAG: hypothetical protein C4544_03495 [candidate division WS5 bacterium]
MPEEIKKVRHPIDEMFADFGFYKDPKMLKVEFWGLIDTKSANAAGIEKYLELLSYIQYAWQKVLKYEKYFAVFYTSDQSIENFEALYHHIHAYLQDMDTLKNKIEVFFGALKNDLKKSASNKEDVIAFIDAGIKKTYEVFDGILKYRHPHVHSGMRFMDGDLLKAETAHFAIEMFSNPTFDALLNQEYKPELIAKFEKEKKESFEVARARWVGMAHNNNEQTSGYLDSLLEAVRPSLYQFLNIKSVKEAIEEAKNKRE